MRTLGVGVERARNDFYPTPPVATYALWWMEGDAMPTELWEPTAGEGHLVRELERKGHRVTATDLYDYGVGYESGIDALTCPRVEARGVVTNPPYSEKFPMRLARRVLIDHEYDYLAMFLRLSFLSSTERYDFFQRECVPSRVYTFCGRVNCGAEHLARGEQTGGMIDYAWVVWDRKRDYDHPTELGYIDTRAMLEKWRAENAA